MFIIRTEVVGMRNDQMQKEFQHFENKQEALDWSRNLAKKEGLEMIPHRKDGQIQNPNSYANDPCPPRDKKY